MKTRFAQRLAELIDDANLRFSDRADCLIGHTWLAVVSSHLGHSPRIHAQVCRYLALTACDARNRKAAFLVAAGTAIYPWVMRAAELFSIPIVEIAMAGQESSVQSDRSCVTLPESSDVDRDSLVVAIADRVDCVFVRSGGRTFKALENRLAGDRSPTVRVALHRPVLCASSDRAAKRLLQQGAVGWHCIGSPADAGQQERRIKPHLAVPFRSDEDWVSKSDQWLIHCTRSPKGPWPGQSNRQYRDELLLRGSSGERCDRTPLSALRRIVRMQRLVASAVASRHRWPVVCFSACALADLLGRRQYRRHLHRWDYEPYGIAIRRSAAEAFGIKPVVYGSESDRCALPVDQRFRFQPRGDRIDWTAEREWRSLGDVRLDRFESHDIRLFVADRGDLDVLETKFPTSVVGHCLRRS